jgi:hypothetical protein
MHVSMRIESEYKIAFMQVYVSRYTYAGVYVNYNWIDLRCSPEA